MASGLLEQHELGIHAYVQVKLTNPKDAMQQWRAFGGQRIVREIANQLDLHIRVITDTNFTDPWGETVLAALSESAFVAHTYFNLGYVTFDITVNTAGNPKIHPHLIQDAVKQTLITGGVHPYYVRVHFRHRKIEW